MRQPAGSVLWYGVRLSVPAIDRTAAACGGFATGLGGQRISIDCCTAAAQQPGSVVSVEPNENVQSKTEKCGV